MVTLLPHCLDLIRFAPCECVIYPISDSRDCGKQNVAIVANRSNRILSFVWRPLRKKVPQAVNSFQWSIFAPFKKNSKRNNKKYQVVKDFTLVREEYLPTANEVWGKICLSGFQAHTQGGSWGVWPWGISRPTPKGEVDGSGLCGLQAHTWGWEWGVSRPTPGGCIPACTEADPSDGYCCGWYASYWNAFLFTLFHLNRASCGLILPP